MTSRKSRAVNKVLGVAIAALFATTGVMAASVDYANRYVRSSGSVYSDSRSETWSVTENAPSMTGAFIGTVDETRSTLNNSSGGTATLDSSIGTSLFSAEGNVSAFTTINTPTTGYGYPDGDALSFFEVRFTIAEQTAFDLSSLLEAEFGPGSPRLSVSMSLTSSFFNLNFGENYIRSDYSRGLALSGILDPGTYTLRASARADTDYYYRTTGMESGNANYDVSLKLSPVPVPAAVWLFASGLGLLGLSRKKIGRNA